MMAPSKTNRMGTNWWERVVVQRSACAIDAQIARRTERSPLLQDISLAPSSVDSVALLYREEVALGKLLGSGTYSNVYEVTGLDLLEEQPKLVEGSDPLLVNEARQKLKKSDAKYAIKHLKPELLTTTKTFEHAACDLIMEAKFLAQFSHPNILALHGVAFGEAANYACTGLYDSFFIVVEKIDETLSDRLRRWRLERIGNRRNPENGTLAKIEIALQIADALNYLHEKRLVFRDLKPQNIGLITSGYCPTVKLFDFGFCRELPIESGKSNGDQGPLLWEVVPDEIETGGQPVQEETDGHDHVNRLYGMSGKGTLMYMSPEVLGTRHYNLKADVYGFATIFYEMLTLQKPYVIESLDAHGQAIFKRGERPPLKNMGIPQPIKTLLVNCWDGNIVNRFSIKEAKAHLEFIHSDFVPGLLTSESFHKAMDSTKKLLSPLQDALSTFAQDVQTGYETLVKDMVSGLPLPTSCENNKDPETMHTVLMHTMHTGHSMSSSSLSGLSFAADDEDYDGEESFVNEFEGADEALAEEAEEAPEEDQEVVLDDEASEETVEDMLEAIEEVANPTDGSYSAFLEEAMTDPTDGSYSTIPLEDNECTEADPQTTANFEWSRSNRQAPRGQNGTLVYHRFYGHVSLNVGTKIGDAEDNQDNVGSKRFLWSSHSVCVAGRAA